MRVHRLIFRLDFQRPNFEIIDYPGTVMKMFAEMGGDGYFSEFQDNTRNRGVSAIARDEKVGIFRQFTIEPTGMNFFIETVKGCKLESLSKDESGVMTLFKGVDLFCNHFKIKTFSRAGIRFFILDKLPTNSSSLLSNTRNLLDKDLLDSVSGTLGEIKDIGFAIDGEGVDQLGYHLRMGPYVSDEATKYFSAETSKEIQDSTQEANFICDLDFYEMNFDMTVSAYKWCKTAITKSQKILEMVPNLLTDRG